jgi:serine/threonine protein phosphatase 1
MIAPLRRLLRGKAAAAPASQAAVPEGQRVFAIGDIHGRADLFEALAAAIEAEDAARGGATTNARGGAQTTNARGGAQTAIVLLGDLIDRGPDSARVLGLARMAPAPHRARRRLSHPDGQP